MRVQAAAVKVSSLACRASRAGPLLAALILVWGVASCRAQAFVNTANWTATDTTTKFQQSALLCPAVNTCDPQSVLDGTNATKWCCDESADYTGPGGPPWGSITIDMGRPTALIGFLYSPSKDGNGSLIGNYSVFVSDDPSRFTERVAQSAFEGASVQARSVLFQKSVTARYVRIVILNPGYAPPGTVDKRPCIADLLFLAGILPVKQSPPPPLPPPPLPLPPVPPSVNIPPPTHTKSDATRAGLIAGCTVGGLAVLTLALLALLALFRCRRRRPPPTPHYDSTHSDEMRASAAPDHLHGSIDKAIPVPVITTHYPTSTGGLAPTTTQFATHFSAALPSGTLSSRAATLSAYAESSSASSAASLVRSLSKRLDEMHRSGARLLGRYVLLGAAQRRVGGQGVVQFATREGAPEKQYAIKFYCDARAFRVEQRLYGDPALLRFLAPVDAIVAGESDAAEDEALSTPSSGGSMPPFVVSERGEALDEWCRRREPDFWMSLTIFGHLVRRVSELHEAGLVHRDIKPSNALWLPSTNSWTLIDFGSAAWQGTSVPISCTLAYAPPEVVAALLERRPAVVAAGAMDVWSLGVMSYELFTNARVHREGQEAMFRTLLGERPFPWEAESAEGWEESMRALGLVRDLVLCMLRRDPAQRITMRELHRQVLGLVNK